MKERENDNPSEEERIIMESENSLQSYQCQYCDYEAPTKVLLNLHRMLVHFIDDTPFPCSTCSYRATTEANLNRHVSVAHCTAERSRTTKCPECSYCSLRSNTLRVHIREVHLKLKPHQCGECPFRCSRATDLKRHLVACHEKQGPYRCTQCSYSTSTGSSLSKHVRNYHEE